MEKKEEKPLEMEMNDYKMPQAFNRCHWKHLNLVNRNVKNDDLFVKLFFKTVIYFHKLNGTGLYLQPGIPSLFDYGSTQY